MVSFQNQSRSLIEYSLHQARTLPPSEYNKIYRKIKKRGKKSNQKYTTTKAEELKG